MQAPTIMFTFMVINMTHADELKPPHPINSAILTGRVLEKTLHNSHYRIIGACFWGKKFPPKVETGLSIEQYLPDLIVTVSNQPGNNPWKEANILYENKLAIKSYQAAYRQAMGLPFDVTDRTNQLNPAHLNEERLRIVNVIGSPASLYRLPKVTHKPETSFGTLYYSSMADAASDRTEAGEIAYMATHPHLLVGHEIGTFTHHWGHEIPRLMQVTQPSRFRASVVAAMHAADIVTNTQSLHVAIPTTNSCGRNCVVSNVIYDPEKKRVLWQEIYPKNRMIEPGNPSDFGEIDDAEGNGNYVFVVWRKYRGCVTQSGKYLRGYPRVGKPEKR